MSRSSTPQFVPLAAWTRLALRLLLVLLGTNQYGFDSSGRLAGVTNGGAYSASYTYKPNSDLLESTISRTNSTSVMTTSRSWEHGYRLKSIGHSVSSRTVSGFTYDYDDLDRRWRATLEDSSVWTYGYKLEYSYDSEGRRIAKIVSTWDGSDFSNPVTNRFVYDGWRMVAEFDSSGNPTRSYMWGLDLSGTLDNAGGIGGLLMVRDHVGGTHHFAGSDGNGNVTVLINAATELVSARYEYSPFLGPLRATGPMANLNSHWASSKPWDRETKLSYFGERYYSPALARWTTRDPIEEDGGLNLCAFVGNSPINDFDPFGLTGTLSDTAAGTGGAAGLGGMGAGQAITFLGQVRRMVNAYNDAQQFISDLSDFADAVEGGDSTEILISGLQAASHAFGGGLPGRGGLKNTVGAVANTSVYQAFGKNFETIYVGITKRFSARAREQLKGKGISIVKIKGLERLSPKDARAAEQALIELHKLKKNGGSLINKINRISESNPAYAEMLKRGKELLKKAGYPGAN